MSPAIFEGGVAASATALRHGVSEPHERAESHSALDIIGNGFIARHLQPLSEAHEGVTVLAAGVPRQLLPESETDRERALVGDTIRRCRKLW